MQSRYSIGSGDRQTIMTVRTRPLLLSLVFAVFLIVGACSGGSSATTDGVLVETLVGAGAAAGYVDGDVNDARFMSPEGLAIGADGVIYVVETLSGRIRAIEPDGVVRTVLGADSELRAPHRIAVGLDGAIFVTDTGNERIVRITASGDLVAIAGSGESGFADGPASLARFDFPIGIAVGPDGAVFVADSGNNRVRRIDPTGAVTTVAGDGTRGYRDGPATEARFVGLNEIAVAPDGTVYVSELGARRIRAISPDGQVSTVIGAPGSGADPAAGPSDGPIDQARLGGPSGLVVTAAGTLLVADTGAHQIREIVPGELVRTIAGGGERGFRDGDGSEARFDRPTSLAIHPDGSLVIADTGNHAIRRVLVTDTTSFGE